MWFEGCGKTPCGRVDAEGDGLRVLVCCVECVAQVHQKGVAAPTEVVLDIGIQEPGAVEEVHGRDANRVAGPCKEVLVAGRYVEVLVGDLPEEGIHLGGRDEQSSAGIWVAVNCGWVVVWRAELLCPLDDV